MCTDLFNEENNPVQVRMYLFEVSKSAVAWNLALFDLLNVQLSTEPYSDQDGQVCKYLNTPIAYAILTRADIWSGIRLQISYSRGNHVFCSIHHIVLIPIPLS